MILWENPKHVFWNLESGILSLESGIWSLESEIWSLGRIWSLELGDLESGAWTLDVGVWSLEAKSAILLKLSLQTTPCNPGPHARVNQLSLHIYVRNPIPQAPCLGNNMILGGEPQTCLLESVIWNLESGVRSPESGV